MPPKNPFLLYLRSRLSATIALTGAALVVLSLVVFRGRSLVPILCVLLAYVAVTIVMFFSQSGAREIVKESDESRAAAIKRKISRVADVRERISVIRLGNERICKAIEYFLLESGAYLEKCRELGTYSPVANDRIERVLEICQVFLGELDEESTGRRYGVPGTNTAPSEETAEGFARDILDCARIIKERTVEDLLGGSGAERLEIAEKLDDKV